MSKLVFAILVLGFWINPVQASDTQISNTIHSLANGSGATSNVSVTNDLGSSSNNSSSSSNCTTNVVIDNNGEHKEYHGDCGNFDIKSGNNSVTVSNNSAPGKSPGVLSQATIQPSPSLSPSSPASSSATPSASPIVENVSGFSLVNFLKQELENILKIFHP